jgi:hypothetical protein
MKNKKRLLVAAVIVVIGVFALVDAIKPPDEGLYRKVPHGDHVHYVPKDRDPDTHLDAFPTKLPPAGFRVSPTGTIVPDTLR